MTTESSSSSRRGGVAAFTAVVLLLLITGDRGWVELTAENTTLSHTHRNRKLLLLHHDSEKLNGNETGISVEPNRIWSDKCSKSDIVVSQGPTEPLPNGIPTYTVEIVNTCVSGCDISGIHLSCGWFSSARLINPRVFKRVSFNDCLVNNGTPLANGRTLSFQYANTYPYSLSVSSVRC